MLDTVSLRVSFALGALTLLLLFYAITFRTGRSPYATWWCASLAMFLTGATAYLLSGTAHQVWANPLGNALITLGAGCVWAGSRSLRGLALPGWFLAFGPVVVGSPRSWEILRTRPGQAVRSSSPRCGSSWLSPLRS